MRERLEEFRAVCEEYERSSQHGSIVARHSRPHLARQGGLGLGSNPTSSAFS
jgi:hypothetical protein